MSRPTIVRMLGVGKKIKAHRMAANITQRKMAKLLDIPYSTYSNYENENRTPDTETLQKICDILNITVSDLIGSITGPLEKGPQITDFLPLSPELPLTPERMVALAKEQAVVIAFRKLNPAGQQEAVKRVEELTEISRYYTQTEQGKE